MNNLSQVYRRFLLASAAENEVSQRAAFRLRYNVYCVERGYEDVSQYPEGMETDAYDEHACHALVRVRGQHGAAVGASRLVLDAACQAALPIESHGSVSVSRHLAQVRESAEARLAEVSRLAVTREFASVFHAVAPPTRLRANHVTMGLLAILLQQSWHAGVTHWVALMETGLLRALARVGIQCHPIGSIIEHRGARQPVVARLGDLWGGVKAKGRPLAVLSRDLGVPWDASWSIEDKPRTLGRDIG